MSAELGTTWEAPAHTIAKIEMLRKYLFVWLRILGARFRGVDLWYIDGFAGPGQYDNYPEGSPVAALRAVDDARTAAADWVAGTVHCAFMEEDAARFANLEEVLSAIPAQDGVSRHLFRGRFVEGIEALKRCQPSPFAPSRPIFAFIDPFGIKGLPFATVRELLSKPQREVLINFDSDGIQRIYAAGEAASHRVRLNEVFGDEEWVSELASVPRADIPQRAFAMYKRRLLSIPNVDYVFPFAMGTSAGKVDYHLVFASQHRLGLEKMKEVMSQFASDGEFVFTDSRDDRQTSLFRFDDPIHHASQMLTQFVGQTVTYREVDRYALNESPFKNPKKMLESLEKAGRITVSCTRSNRKPGTYPEDAQMGMLLRFQG